MRAYELMVILDGDLDEQVAQGWVKTISKSIGDAGGAVVGKPDWWGRRRFSHPLKKKEEGYYLVLNVQAEGGALDEVERSFRIADQVVRHKLIRLPDHEAARRGFTVSAG